MGSKSLVRLGPKDAAPAFAFAARHPDRATFVGGWIHDGGLADSPRVARGWLLGELEGSVVKGLAFLSDSGILMPAFSSNRGIDDLIEFSLRQPDLIRVIVGERRLVEALWRGLEKSGAKARLVRDQLGYAISAGQLKSDAAIPLLPAADGDLDDVVKASAAMAREEAKDDPEGRNPTLFRSRIAERVRRGRDFIHRENGQLVFKANVSAMSTIGGQVEGIYTPPEARRRGFGRAGTAAITRLTLQQCGRAFLLVNEDNLAARTLYEHLGYKQVIESRTLFIAP